IYTSDPNDKRHLKVQVWYPAKHVPNSQAAPYVADLDEFTDPKTYEPYLHVKTHAVADAPVARAGKPFPVLVYNHGGGWSRFSATFQMEELASHGYVVMSVDHTGFSQTSKFPDGYVF